MISSCGLSGPLDQVLNVSLAILALIVAYGRLALVPL